MTTKHLSASRSLVQCPLCLGACRTTVERDLFDDGNPMSRYSMPCSRCDGAGVIDPDRPFAQEMQRRFNGSQRKLRAVR